jgi:hypothetical protein
MTRQELEQNIGKRCKITDSPVAAVSGQEGTIKGISGTQTAGFRYDVKVDEPVSYLGNKSIFHPPVFMCEIIE